MTFKALWLTIFGLLLGTSLHGQELAGDWKGTLQAGNQPLRLIIKFKRADSGGWTGAMYSIDQGNDWGAGTAISSITLLGAQVKFVVDGVRGTYDGKVTSDGSSIEGTWTQRQPLPLVLRRATPETAWKDPATHTIRFVTVDKNVKLEVLDFGGSGRPLVFLAGMGNTAHVFDTFTPKFTATYHVYGITRRGFGDSSVPPDGYAADRLGDDVLAVLDALKLTRPVLAGHSIAGQELSSIASGPVDNRPTIKELLAELPRFERNLQARQKELDAMPPALLATASGPAPSVPRAIMAGGQKYTSLSAVPILAIYALPHDPGPFVANEPAARAAREAEDLETTGVQAAAFEKGVPSARVVRIPHANHYVFRSNEADVLREMNAFLAGLK